MTKQIITIAIGIALVISGLFADKVKKNAPNGKKGFDYVYLFGGLLIVVIGLFIMK